MAQADHLPNPNLDSNIQAQVEQSTQRRRTASRRRYFIGGSDARIIMGDDQDALVRLWREKRGEVEPQDLSGNLIVQLGVVTEALNRRWYEANTGAVLTDIQKRVFHPALKWMAATLDGRVVGSDAVFEGKFMLPWSFSEEGALAKYSPQLQHNMWVVAARTAVLSVITGGGKWVEIVTHADPLYQHLIVTAERKFWRCVESGEEPKLFGVEPPKPRVEAIRIVDMTTSNAWAEFAASFVRTQAAHAEHETAKAELKKLVPEDAKEAIGHGLRAKRSKAGAISFELLGVRGTDGGEAANDNRIPSSATQGAADNRIPRSGIEGAGDSRIRGSAGEGANRFRSSGSESDNANHRGANDSTRSASSKSEGVNDNRIYGGNSKSGNDNQRGANDNTSIANDNGSGEGRPHAALQ